MTQLDDIRKLLHDPLSEWEQYKFAAPSCDVCIRQHEKGERNGPGSRARFWRHDCVQARWSMCRKHALEHTATAPDGVAWTGPPVKPVRGERCACQVPAVGRYRVVTPQTIVHNTIEYCDGDVVPLCHMCHGRLSSRGVRLLTVRFPT